MSERVLVVAAHTDDEAFGCAGAIARHVERGDGVAAVHLTDGVGARVEAGVEEVASRSRAAEEAAEVLGFEWVAGGGFPDNALDSVPLLEVVRFVESAVQQVEPSLIYAHHGADLNVDHRIAFQAVLTACRPQPGSAVREIRSFEVPSSTEWSHETIGPAFRPSLFIDIEPFWAQKRRALEAYSDELREAPHVRSLEAIDTLARRRGNEVGLVRAEAFDLVRRIES